MATINSDKLNILKFDNEVIYYMVDKDLIIFYSSDFYNKKVLFELRDIAFRISNDKNKRVSIGYLYRIPIEQQPHESISQQIEIISFKNCEEISERTYPTPHFTFYDLFELALATTEEYDVKKYVRKKKS